MNLTTRFSDSQFYQRILKDSVYILHNPLWLVWIFRTPILGNTSWWLLLYVLEVLVFQNTSKWMLSSLSNRVIFFLGIFLFKESPKRKHVPSFSLLWWEGIPSLLFIMFSWLHFTLWLFKNFSLLTKLKRFWFL